MEEFKNECFSKQTCPIVSRMVRLVGTGEVMESIQGGLRTADHASVIWMLGNAAGVGPTSKTEVISAPLGFGFPSKTRDCPEEPSRNACVYVQRASMVQE